MLVLLDVSDTLFEILGGGGGSWMPHLFIHLLVYVNAAK